MIRVCPCGSYSDGVGDELLSFIIHADENILVSAHFQNVALPMGFQILIRKSGIFLDRHQQVLASVKVIHQRKVLIAAAAVMGKSQLVVQYIPIVAGITAGQSGAVRLGDSLGESGILIDVIICVAAVGHRGPALRDKIYIASSANPVASISIGQVSLEHLEAVLHRGIHLVA